MRRPVVHFILPPDICFTTQPALMGRALYSPVAGPLAVAAVTPRDEWDCVLTDGNVEPVDCDRPCDLAAISIMTVYAHRGYEIADRLRARGVPVVIGGVHATFLPSEALQHADAVVVGEAELVWPRVLADARAGRLRGVYAADRWHDMRGMPPLPWTLLRRDRYLVTSFVQTSRGCPHRCDFCCEKGMNGVRTRMRPVPEVATEVAALPDRDIGIYDADVFARPERALRLMDAVAPLGKRWHGAVSSRVAESDALLAAARRSGCFMLDVGFESLSERNLRSVHKGFNRPERYRALIEKIHSHGVMVLALCMFGFDEDDESVFESTARFFLDAGADAAAFSVLTPYPGTALCHRLHGEGRITSYDWSRYDQSDVVFEPRRMSQETLRAGFGHAYDVFYSRSSILRRFPVLGGRDRFYWAVTNAVMRGFDRREAARNRIARDDTPYPGDLLAPHARPGASGLLHPLPPA